MSETFLERFAHQANDVLGAVLDQTADCIKLVSLDGEIEFVNANGARALGLEDGAEIIGKPWAELWPQESQGRVRQAISRASRGQTDRFEGYCPIVDGVSRW